LSIAGVVANQTAGPAVCLSFVVGGVCALLSSFIYAEVRVLMHISCATPHLSALTLQEKYGHGDRPVTSNFCLYIWSAATSLGQDLCVPAAVTCVDNYSRELSPMWRGAVILCIPWMCGKRSLPRSCQWPEAVSPMWSPAWARSQPSWSWQTWCVCEPAHLIYIYPTATLYFV